MTEDGQVLLTAYADSVPGTVCLPRVDLCPHKTRQWRSVPGSGP